MNGEKNDCLSCNEFQELGVLAGQFDQHLGVVAVDAPEPKAHAYLSSSPAGPALEREQEHPHLKA